MDDEKIAEFTAITAATPELARQYITLGDGNVEQAIQLFFESGGVDMGATYDTAQQQSAPAVPPASSRPAAASGDDPIQIDSDDENSDGGIPVNDRDRTTDDDEAMARKMQEDDEAMARRLQEEAYGAGGGGGGGGGGAGGDGMDIDPETGVRRPMARTTETLATGFGGPSRYDDDDEIRAAVREQLMARQRHGESEDVSHC